jgi:Disulphide bond corrector protein DsbC
MRPRLAAVVLGLAWGLVGPAQAQVASRPRGGPEVKAGVVGGPVSIDAAGAATFRVGFEVPPGHHGYLDRGDSGFLIPFTFTFPALEERGAKVTVASSPRGAREDKFRATVLRGAGEFAFRLETGTRIPAGAVLPASLRYQICNDVTNLCYSPRRVEIPLRFAGASR